MDFQKFCHFFRIENIIEPRLRRPRVLTPGRKQAFLDLDKLDLRESFLRLKVYTGSQWEWVHYPTRYNRYFEQRRAEPGWETESPKLILSKDTAAIHFLQSKTITAKKIVESKRNPDLVTVAVDLNVKHLAVITVRQHSAIIQTRFVSDHGLDQHRYRHLKRIAKRQWQSGKPIKGERSNRQLWRHIRRQNTDAAHKTARAIVEVCEQYPGCVLLFERLRVIKRAGGSKSRRLNRKQANQLRGKINQFAKEKAYASGIMSVEVNAHGTSQYCARCGARGLRFSLKAGQQVITKGGKLFFCPHSLSGCRSGGRRLAGFLFHKAWEGPAIPVKELSRNLRLSLSVGGPRDHSWVFSKNKNSVFRGVFYDAFDGLLRTLFTLKATTCDDRGAETRV